MENKCEHKDMILYHYSKAGYPQYYCPDCKFMFCGNKIIINDGKDVRGKAL